MGLLQKIILTFLVSYALRELHHFQHFHAFYKKSSVSEAISEIWGCFLCVFFRAFWWKNQYWKHQCQEATQYWFFMFFITFPKYQCMTDPFFCVFVLKKNGVISRYRIKHFAWFWNTLPQFHYFSQILFCSENNKIHTGDGLCELLRHLIFK